MPIEIVCSECGSTDVGRDAWAAWDRERQKWVIHNVFDDGHCFRCDVTVRLEERPIDTATSVVTY